MPECTCCQKQYSWWQMVKANFLYGQEPCSSCGCEHKVTLPTRFVVTGMTVLPFTFFVLVLTPFQTLFLNILVGLFMVVGGLFLTPFVSNYKLVSK